MTPQTPLARSWPVLWWELINEVDALAAEHHLGLANVWELIHKCDYTGARELLDIIRAAVSPIASTPESCR